MASGAPFVVELASGMKIRVAAGHSQGRGGCAVEKLPSGRACGGREDQNRRASAAARRGLVSQLDRLRPGLGAALWAWLPIEYHPRTHCTSGREAGLQYDRTGGNVLVDSIVV